MLLFDVPLTVMPLADQHPRAVEDAAKHISEEFDQVEGQKLRFRQENGGLQSHKEKTFPTKNC